MNDGPVIQVKKRRPATKKARPVAERPTGAPAARSNTNAASIAFQVVGWLTFALGLLNAAVSSCYALYNVAAVGEIGFSLAITVSVPFILGSLAVACLGAIVLSVQPKD